MRLALEHGYEQLTVEAITEVLMIPMMAALLVSSIVSGQLVSKTGRPSMRGPDRSEDGDA